MERVQSDSLKERDMLLPEEREQMFKKRLNDHSSDVEKIDPVGRALTYVRKCYSDTTRGY